MKNEAFTSGPQLMSFCELTSGLGPEQVGKCCVSWARPPRRRGMPRADHSGHYAFDLEIFLMDFAFADFIGNTNGEMVV